MKPLLRVLVAVASIGVVGYALFAYGVKEPGSTVHPQMKNVFQQHPVRMYLHVFGSAVALATGPFQFFESLRKRKRIHRALGMIYFAAVFIGGISGFAMAFIAYGGVTARLGFGLGAILWIYTAIRALVAIRQRNYAAHEAWAVRCFSLTFAAVTLRIYLALFFGMKYEFDEFYPSLGWLSWVPNLIIAEWFLIRRDSNSD